MEEIISIENLKKSFGNLDVIKNISFSVHKGEVLGIIGPSGSGKSTILRCISQLEEVTDGTIKICGQTLVALPFPAEVFFCFCAKAEAIPTIKVTTISQTKDFLAILLQTYCYFFSLQISLFYPPLIFELTILIVVVQTGIDTLDLIYNPLVDSFLTTFVKNHLLQYLEILRD